jgi:hypothetical protein
MDEPLSRLQQAAAQAGLENRIQALREGDTSIFP